MKTYLLECVELLKRARAAFQAGRTLTESFRQAQLEAVVRMLEEHECDFVDALGRDLHKVGGKWGKISLNDHSQSVTNFISAPWFNVLMHRLFQGCL